MKDSFLGRAPGVPNDVIPIAAQGVVDGSVQVYTIESGRHVDWTHVDRLAYSGPTHSAFTTWVDEAGITVITFGDNAMGRIPPAGVEMYVTYRFGIGTRANALPVGGITVIDPPAQDYDPFGFEFTNPSVPQGAADPESVESMRYSIPRAAGRIKSRAVTLEDYADLALQVPGVAKAIAHGLVYDSVFVRIAPVGGEANEGSLPRLKRAVEQYLEGKVMIGSQVIAEPETAG